MARSSKQQAAQHKASLVSAMRRKIQTRRMAKSFEKSIRAYPAFDAKPGGQRKVKSDHIATQFESELKIRRRRGYK